MRQVLLTIALAVLACSNDARNTDAANADSPTVRDSLAAEAARKAAQDCGVGQSSVLNENGLGAFRIGVSVADLGINCDIVQDTTGAGTEGMPERRITVALASDSIAATVVEDRVWRIEIDSPNYRTPDRLGVGITGRELRRRQGTLATGEGRVFALLPDHCGLSFRLQGVAQNQGWNSLPDTARVDRVLVIGCSTPPADGIRQQSLAEPVEILEQAIQRAGGAAALERARALTWTGEAIVHAGGRTVDIEGRWAVQPPDTAVVSTFDITRGRHTTRHLVLASPNAWIVRDTQFAPMPPNMLASERDAFYLYSVIRLVPLRNAMLSRISPDSAGNEGIRASMAGRPAVDLYVDATGRLRHFRTTVIDAESGKPARAEVSVHGAIEADSVRWPRGIRFRLDGKPYFDLTVRSLRTGAQLSDTLLNGPPSSRR
jgi:hypothetical protein